MRSIKTARQGCDVSLVDVRKINQHVSRLGRYKLVVTSL